MKEMLGDQRNLGKCIQGRQMEAQKSSDRKPGEWIMPWWTNRHKRRVEQRRGRQRRN